VQIQPDDGVAIGATGTVSGSDYRPVTVDLVDPATFGEAAEPSAADYRDAAAMGGIPVVAVQIPADVGPRIRVIGGGPMNGVPQAYANALDGLLGQLSGPQWRTWWSAADQEVLEIFYDFAATTTGIAARRAGNTLRTTIRRPVSAFAKPQDHAATARRDVEALLATVRRRTGLGEHPPLPG
jgi:hypothetical protein